MKDELYFEIVKEMEKIKCEFLFSFSNNNINYIVYTDNTKDEDGDLNILASRYEIKDGKLILSNIEEDYEFDLVDEMIKKMGDN